MSHFKCAPFFVPFILVKIMGGVESVQVKNVVPYLTVCAGSGTDILSIILRGSVFAECLSGIKIRNNERG